MKKPQKKSILILLGNILVIFLAGINFLFSVKHLPVVDNDAINTSAFRSGNVDFRDGTFFVNDNIKDNGEKTDFLWGPYQPLKKGSYTAVIQYTAESDQSCYAGDMAHGGESQHYRAAVDTLSSYKNTAYYQFELVEDVEEFQLVIEYSGWGEFGVRSISIVPNNMQAKRIFAEILMALFAADMLILFFGLPREKKLIAFSLAGITLLISMPLFIKGLHYGHDMEIHLLRIESIADALRSGQFPARISTLALWGLGYPFSIYYNDIFLYFPAVLRLLGFSVNTAYKFYLLGINFLTVLIAYISFKGMFKSRKIGVILSLLYSTASYRYVNTYVRAAVGEYTAMAFLPLIALALWRMYSDEPKENGAIVRNAMLLAVGFSGIIGCHVLTLVMIAFLMLVVVLVLFRKTFRKNVMLSFALAALMTILINLYFLVPFADYYVNVPSYIGDLVSGKADMIQESGVFPGQFFSFFQHVDGNMDDVIDNRFQSTPGLALMAVFVFAVYYRLFYGGGKRFKFLLYFSAFVLFMSTDVFPWNWLSLRLKVWGMVTQIQFPWRFLVFAVLFLTLLTGEMLKENMFPSAVSAKLIAAMAVLMAVWYASDLYNNGNTMFYFDTLSLDPSRTGHEYLLSGTKWEKYDPYLHAAGMDTAQVLSQKSNRMELYCKTAGSDIEHVVEAPLFAYKGYHVFDKSGQELSIQASEQKHITFVLPDDYDGNITIIFMNQLYWTAALWISAAAVLGILLFEWKYRRRLTD